MRLAFHGAPFGSSMPPLPARTEVVVFIVVSPRCDGAGVSGAPAGIQRTAGAGTGGARGVHGLPGCGAGASGARAPLGVRLAAFAAADPGSRGHSRSLVRGRHRAGRSRCLRRPAPSCGSSSSVSSCLTVNPERVCSSHPVLPSRAVILIAVPTRIWSVFLPALRYHQGAPRNAFVTRERVSRDRKDLAA